MVTIIYIATIISASLMALTLTFDNLWLIALVTLVPYIRILFTNELTYKQVFRLGITFGFTYYFVLLHWILSMYPLDRYGLSNLESIVVLILGWIALSFYEGLWLAIIPVIFKKLKGKAITNILVIASLWVVVEWLQQVGLLGFSWGQLGISQVGEPLMIQGASILGSLSISFMVVVINSIICYGLINRKKYKIAIIGVSTILIINMGFGAYNIKNISEGEEVKIALIQGNISSNDKWVSSSLNKHLDTYLTLSYNAYEEQKALDYIVWPETAIPVTLLENNAVLNKYKKLASDTNSTLIVGAYHQDNNDSYNSIYGIYPEGEVSEPYSKRQLVPFGEFLPFQNTLSKMIPILEDINLFEDNIVPGTDVSLIETSKGKVGALICFESIFARLTRDITKEGAEIIVIGTNDSWFKNSRGVYEHLKQSILRAVESNRYVIRAANTGVTAVVDSKGRVIDGIDALKTGYIISDAKLIDEKTPYTYIGDVIVLLSMIYILSVVIRKKVSPTRKIW